MSIKEFYAEKAGKKAGLGKVDTKWNAPEGFFDKSAEKIASGLKKASKDLKQAMSRLSFYINRGGKNINAADKKRLEAAKDKLRGLYKAESAQQRGSVVKEAATELPAVGSVYTTPKGKKIEVTKHEQDDKTSLSYVIFKNDAGELRKAKSDDFIAYSKKWQLTKPGNKPAPAAKESVVKEADEAKFKSILNKAKNTIKEVFDTVDDAGQWFYDEVGQALHTQIAKEAGVKLDDQIGDNEDDTVDNFLFEKSVYNMIDFNCIIDAKAYDKVVAAVKKKFGKK